MRAVIPFSAARGARRYPRQARVRSAAALQLAKARAIARMHVSRWPGRSDVRLKSRHSPPSARRRSPIPLVVRA